MKIQPQTQNFGAIKIKGIKPGTNEAETLMKTAMKYEKTADFGETRFGQVHRYIQATHNSDKEFYLFGELSKIFKAQKVKVELIDDNKAAIDVKRFLESQPLLVKLFNIKK